MDARIDERTGPDEANSVRKRKWSSVDTSERGREAGRTRDRP